MPLQQDFYLCIVSTESERPGECQLYLLHLLASAGPGNMYISKSNVIRDKGSRTFNCTFVLCILVNVNAFFSPFKICLSSSCPALNVIIWSNSVVIMLFGYYYAVKAAEELHECCCQAHQHQEVSTCKTHRLFFFLRKWNVSRWHVGNETLILMCTFVVHTWLFE